MLTILEFRLIRPQHGGRQLDGSVSALHALKKVAEEVKGRFPIGFDSGIRSGSDIFKALALGADFVQLGRPILWGMALDGENGIRHVLKTMLADLDLHVRLSGCTSIQDVTKDLLVDRWANTVD